LQQLACDGNFTRGSVALIQGPSRIAAAPTARAAEVGSKKPLSNFPKKRPSESKCGDEGGLRRRVAVAFVGAIGGLTTKINSCIAPSRRRSTHLYVLSRANASSSRFGDHDGAVSWAGRLGSVAFYPWPSTRIVKSDLACRQDTGSIGNPISIV